MAGLPVTLPEGWLTEAEAGELRRLARGGTVLELGAWKGRSTVVLAETAHYVISVDRHRGIPPDHPEDSLPDYLVGVRDLPNVAIVVADFAAFVPLLGGVGVVYIDGDHTREAVERDTKLAELMQPFIVAYHDWDFPEVEETATMLWERDPDTIVGSVASYET